MKVLHVTTSLEAGGAQAMLHKVVSATLAEAAHSVVSLTDQGAFGPRFGRLGVEVACLGMRPGVPRLGALASLARRVERERPDVVQSWMYHADLLAGLACAPRRIPVVWGIHHSNVDPRGVKPLTRWTRGACARLSGLLADRIVCCGDSALRAHAALGYRADRMVVIQNGFAVGSFRPDPAARARVRGELGIPELAPVVGLVARYHPDKDHGTFIAAARRVADRAADAVFLMAGEGVAETNAEMGRRIDGAGLRPRVRLLGHRDDVPGVLAALDVLASSSRTEGFPQVLGEGLLCGVPCAATDCGDSREIVGEAGRVVPPGDPEALAAAILELVGLPAERRAALGAAGRQRIQARFDITAQAGRYLALYREVLRARRAPEGRRPEARP